MKFGPKRNKSPNGNGVPARKFCLRAKVAPTTHFWGPDFSRKVQYLSNMQKRRNGWAVKYIKMAVYLKLTWSIRFSYTIE